MFIDLFFCCCCISTESAHRNREQKRKKNEGGKRRQPELTDAETFWCISRPHPHTETRPLTKTRPRRPSPRPGRCGFVLRVKPTPRFSFYFILFCLFVSFVWKLKREKKNDTTAPLSSSCCRSSSSSLMATPLFVHNPALVPSYSSSSPVRVRVFHCISVGACVCV